MLQSSDVAARIPAQDLSEGNLLGIGQAIR
jgi:hypothetical protein